MDAATVEIIKVKAAQAAMQAMEDRKEAIINDCGGAVVRMVVRNRWDNLKAVTKDIVDGGTVNLLDQMTKLTVSDVIQMVVIHAQARGLSCFGSKPHA